MMLRRYPFFTHLKLRPVQKIGVFLVACIILLAPLNTTQSQNSEAPIYDGSSPRSLAWSSDSKAVVFLIYESETTVHTLLNSWFKYDVTTRTLSQGNVWPLQPLWTREQTDLFQPYKDTHSESFVFQSPNHRFAVYRGIGTGSEIAPLKIANQDTSEITSAAIFAASATLGPDFFSVWWNGDGTRFIARSSTIDDYSPLYFYVYGYTPDMQNMQYMKLATFNIEGNKYGVTTVFDLSGDGIRMLATEDYLTGSEYRSRVVIQNVIQPELSVVVPGDVLEGHNVEAAAFDPDDENKIIALTKSGLLRVDYAANTQDILNARLNSRNVSDAVFSPDGRYLAVVYETALNAGALYILDMRENRLLPAATSAAEPTPLPTGAN
jgi:dipeptidyl aminopeptidase/acylaminoacyl peptidase